MSTPLKVALGVGALAVVLVVVVLALTLRPGGGEDESGRTQGITAKQFRAVRPGASEAEIEERFGTAQDRQKFEEELSGREEPESSSCLYYPERGKELDEGRTFQFCFVEEKLDTKNVF